MSEFAHWWTNSQVTAQQLFVWEIRQRVLCHGVHTPHEQRRINSRTPHEQLEIGGNPNCDVAHCREYQPLQAQTPQT
jgi:hypothetical protein